MAAGGRIGVHCRATGDTVPGVDPRLADWFRLYGPGVFRRARQLLGSDALAEEATQEVFIRAAKALHRYDPRARPSTWLYRITTNYCLNQIRDRARRRELLDARQDELVPGSAAYDPQRLIALRALLADADEREATAAVAVFVDGMSHAEAAEILQVSRRTVGNLCDRFLAWARARLGAEE